MRQWANWANLRVGAEQRVRGSRCCPSSEPSSIPRDVSCAGVDPLLCNRCRPLHSEIRPGAWNITPNDTAGGSPSTNCRLCRITMMSRWCLSRRTPSYMPRGLRSQTPLGSLPCQRNAPGGQKQSSGWSAVCRAGAAGAPLNATSAAPDCPRSKRFAAPPQAWDGDLT